MKIIIGNHQNVGMSVTSEMFAGKNEIYGSLEK